MVEPIPKITKEELEESLITMLLESAAESYSKGALEDAVDYVFPLLAMYRNHLIIIKSRELLTKYISEYDKKVDRNSKTRYENFLIRNNWEDYEEYVLEIGFTSFRVIKFTNKDTGLISLKVVKVLSGRGQLSEQGKDYDYENLLPYEDYLIAYDKLFPIVIDVRNFSLFVRMDKPIVTRLSKIVQKKVFICSGQWIEGEGIKFDLTEWHPAEKLPQEKLSSNNIA